MKKVWIILLIVLGVLIAAGVVTAILLKQRRMFEPMDGPGMVYEIVVDELEHVETNHVTDSTYRLHAVRSGGKVHLTSERRASETAEPVVREADADAALLDRIGEALLNAGLERAANYAERDPYRMPDVTSRMKVTEPYFTFTVTSLMELSEQEQTGWNEVVQLIEAALNEPTYAVEYDHESWYENAEPAYAAGETVMLYVSVYATDTDYSFLLDGESLNYSFDDEKGMVVTFVMPDHPVKLECVTRNSMLYDPDA